MLRRALVVATVLACLSGGLCMPAVGSTPAASSDASLPSPASADLRSNAGPGASVASDLTGEVTNLTTWVSNLTIGVSNATVEGAQTGLDIAVPADDDSDFGNGTDPSKTAGDGANVGSDAGAGTSDSGSNEDSDLTRDGATADGSVSATTNGTASDGPGATGVTPIRDLLNGTLRPIAPPNGSVGTERPGNASFGDERSLNETFHGVGSLNETFRDERFLNATLRGDGDETVLNEDGLLDLGTPGLDDGVGARNGSVATSRQDPIGVVAVLRAVTGVTDVSLSDLLAELTQGDVLTAGTIPDRDEPDVGLDAPREQSGDGAESESAPDDAAPDAGTSDPSEGGGRPDDDRENGAAADGSGGGGGGADPGSGAGAGAAMVVTVGCLGGTRTAVDQAATLASPGWRTALATLRQQVGLHLGEFTDRFLPVAIGSSTVTSPETLDNETRAEMYDLVRESPGTYHAQLADEIGVTEETIRYHSRVLVDEGLVETRKHRGRRRLYPVTAGSDEPELADAMADSPASDVLSVVQRREPTTLSSIAEALECAPSTVAHHLDRLEEDGLVTRERDGGSVTVELQTATRSVLESPVADD